MQVYTRGLDESYSAKGYRSMPMCLSRNLTSSTWIREAAKGDCRPDGALTKSLPLYRNRCIYTVQPV